MKKKVDNIDVKILSTLHKNGRASKYQVSEHSGLSPTPCWNRTRKLESLGVIRGYTADINLHKLCSAQYYFVEITITDYSRTKASILEKVMQQTDTIIECCSTLGSVDYLLKVIVANNDHYNKFIETLRTQSNVEFDYRTLPAASVLKSQSNIDIEGVYGQFDHSNKTLSR